jgi:hypothetical protein
MSTRPEQPNPPPAQPRKDTERETREAIVEDAGKADVDGRDLVHGEGGTLGLGEYEDLNRDD